jgi:hypothetical protein
MRANFAKIFVGFIVTAGVLVTVGTWTIRHVWEKTPAPAIVAAIDQPVPESALPSTQPAKSLGDQIADQLSSDDPAEQQKAIDRIRGLEDTSPKTIAESLADWRPMLMAAKEYQLVEDLGMIAIDARPYDITIVQSAQKGRVMGLLAEEKYDQALAEARSFYNVATLKSTNDAIDLMYRALNKSRDPAVATGFKMQQIADGDAPLPTASLAAFTNSDASTRPTQPSVLDSIEVDTDIYAPVLNSVGVSKGYKNLVTRGYLYLLCNRAAEAQKCFEDACKLANGGGRQMREAVEGIAQSMRAEDGNVARANAFILSLQQDPTPLVSKLVPRTKDGAEKLRLAAQQTVLAQVNMMNVPPLEEARAKSEDANADIHITADFDCSTPIDVTRISPTHFRVAITTNGFRDWFMFRLTGVAGKTVRIDLTGDNIEMFKWWSLNPLVTYATDTNALETYTTVPSRQPPDTAWNGAQLPPTDGQSWHFIPGVWREGPTNTLSLVEHFDEDQAVIAMRVPYTPGYNQKYLAQLAAGSAAKVIQIGQSPQGRPLQLAIVGDDPSHPRPCVLIYAREHADEHDTSWVAQGALEYLISDDPQAQALRQRFTFIVIPLLDPDSAAASFHEVMMTSFLPGKDNSRIGRLRQLVSILDRRRRTPRSGL